MNEIRTISTKFYPSLNTWAQISASVKLMQAHSNFKHSSKAGEHKQFIEVPSKTFNEKARYQLMYNIYYLFQLPSMDIVSKTEIN